MPELGKDERLLNRKEAAIYLKARGHSISYGHLTNLAKGNNSGGGPPFYKDERRALYSVDDLETWRRARLHRVG